MSNYVPKTHEDNGGDDIVVESGGVINVKTGGQLQINGRDVTPQLASATGTVVGGSYTAIAADDTAGSHAIVTGLTTVDSFVVTISRSGVPVASDQVVTASGGTITVADGGATYAVTAGDVFTWIAVGAV